MANFILNTYTLKRKIINFTNKIWGHLTKPECKFTADITYDMLASGSCLLTNVVDQLHEDSKKINIVAHLSRHLEKGTPSKSAVSYASAPSCYTKINFSFNVKIIVSKIKFSDAAELEFWKMNLLQKGDMVTVTYFCKMNILKRPALFPG